jgi:hypothetical protein
MIEIKNIVPECSRIFNRHRLQFRFPLPLAIEQKTLFVKSASDGLPNRRKWAKMEANAGVRMKPKRVPLPNMYDEAQVRKSGWKYPSRRALLRFGLVLAILIAVRFLNLSLLWTVSRLELEKGSPTGSGEYVFLGVAGRADTASLQLAARTIRPGADTVVIGYHDLFHPARFLIRARQSVSFVDIGPAVLAVGPGVSAVTFCASEIIKIGVEGTTRAVYLGESPLAPLFHRMARRMANTSRSATPVSFLLKPPEKSPYLRIPPLLYFDLPGVLILLLAAFFSPAMFTAFFYYLEFFVLFSGKKAMVSVPFFWLFPRLGVEPSDPWLWAIAVLLLALSALLAISGLRRWEKIERGSREKWFVLFFLLLPFALRF